MRVLRVGDGPSRRCPGQQPHVNPCTDTVALVEWETEHRNLFVDEDGEAGTDQDRVKAAGVMELLWAYSEEARTWWTWEAR
jgi:hypothetical protein